MRFLRKICEVLLIVSDYMGLIGLLAWRLSGSEAVQTFALVWIVCISSMATLVVFGHWVFKEPIRLATNSWLRDVLPPIGFISTEILMLYFGVNAWITAFYVSSHAAWFFTAGTVRKSQRRR